MTTTIYLKNTDGARWYFHYSKQKAKETGPKLAGNADYHSVFLTTDRGQATPVLFKNGMMVFDTTENRELPVLPYYLKCEEGRGLDAGDIKSSATSSARAKGIAGRQIQQIPTPDGGFQIQWTANTAFYIGLTSGGDYPCVSAHPVTLYREVEGDDVEALRQRAIAAETECALLRTKHAAALAALNA